jgi:uncharacterized protein
MNLHLARIRKWLAAGCIGLSSLACAQQPAPPDPDLHQGGLAWLTGNRATALRHFRLAAERGDRLGQYNLAMMLLLGEASTPRPREALFWLEKAAHNGLARAQHELAEQYAQGRHVRASWPRAIQWYSMAAEQGWVESQLRLGHMYLHGQGVPRNEDQALSWYLKAAAQGHPEARAKALELAGRPKV